MLSAVIVRPYRSPCSASRSACCVISLAILRCSWILHGDRRLSCSTITFSFLAEILFSKPMKVRILMQELQEQLVGWHSSFFSPGYDVFLGEEENSSADKRLVGVSPPVMVDASGDETRVRAHMLSLEPRLFRAAGRQVIANEEQLVGESESEADGELVVVHSFVREAKASTGIVATGLSPGERHGFFRSASRSGLAGLSFGVFIRGTSHVGVWNPASTLGRFVESTETSLEESNMSSAVSAAERHLSMLWQSYTVMASC